MTTKDETRDRNTLRANISKTAGDAIFSNNRYLLFCEAVWSAIIATA